jgi:hypothetical protein
MTIQKDTLERRASPILLLLIPIVSAACSRTRIEETNDGASTSERRIARNRIFLSSNGECSQQ